MFIIQNGKLTGEKTLDIGKLRSLNLAFAFDISFEDADKFQLSIDGIPNALYGFTNSGEINFARVDFSFIKSKNTSVEIKIQKNGTYILADFLSISAVVQGGDCEIQGLIFKQGPKKATEMQIIPSDFTKDWTSFSYMFSGCTSLTTIPLFDTSKGTDFDYMFLDCYALTTIPLFDTSNGTNFSRMFRNCTSLTTIPLLNTSNGQNMAQMFGQCHKLTSIPELDSSNNIDFQFMFNNCYVLTTIPLLNTSSGQNFEAMFEVCRSLTTIPLLDTSSGIKFRRMFENCTSLTTIPLLDTSKGTDFYQMFCYDQNLISVPALDTSKGTDFSRMFYDCKALTTIQGIDFSSVKATIGNSIFYNCNSLKNVTFNGTLSQSIDISGAPNLTKESLQSLVNACTSVTSSKYITSSGQACSLLNSYYKTALANKGWGLKQG